MNERFFLLKDRAQVVMEKKLLGLLIWTDFKLYRQGIFLYFYYCYLKNVTNMQMLSMIELKYIEAYFVDDVIIVLLLSLNKFNQAVVEFHP